MKQKLQKQIELAEAIEIADYYLLARHIDSYFQNKWIWAEENLNEKLDNLLGLSHRDAPVF